MVSRRFYPPADLRSQWFGEGAITMPRIDKLVLHTTESAGGWPGYQGGAITPTLTYEPWRHAWRQHLPVNGSARALVDGSGTAVRENRDNVAQLEISCYCDPRHADSGRFVTDLDDQALHDLGAFVGWLHEHWELPLALAPAWLPYPQSAGASPVRMSGPEYDRFRGVLGHQHVSINDHGDPGALNVEQILAYAGGQPTPPRAVAHWSLADWEAGDPATVAATDAELLRRGFLRRASRSHPGERGLARVAAVRRWQRSIGNAAEFSDGVFGSRQWTRFWAQSAAGQAARTSAGEH
ncbi:hypothetical protein [uncultured Friedmanniella sp.]|uniref:hypothetical protein n=1 Tax=uncultured Friedmanniella sp. TaxID=335381 RepID=UPI0035C95A48